GHLTYFNKAAAETAGRAPALGTDKWCVLPEFYDPGGKPLPPEESPLAKVVRSRGPIAASEIMAERPDGKRIPLMPFPTPLYDPAGRFSGAVNMLVDITDRKRIEQSLARRVRHQAALYNFTDRLQRAHSLSEVYEAAIDAVLEALQ